MTASAAPFVLNAPNCRNQAASLVFAAGVVAAGAGLAAGGGVAGLVGVGLGVESGGALAFDGPRHRAEIRFVCGFDAGSASPAVASSRALRGCAGRGGRGGTGRPAPPCPCSLSR